MSSNTKGEKKSAYSKRNESGIAAPMQVDTDSDFNPGPIPSSEDEKAKKNKKKKKVSRNNRKSEAKTKRGRKRKYHSSESDSDYEEESTLVESVISPGIAGSKPTYPDLLVMYFGRAKHIVEEYGDEEMADDEDEEEDDDEDDDDEDEDEDEDEDVEMRSASDEEKSRALKPPSNQRQVAKATTVKLLAATEDNSSTESASDNSIEQTCPLNKGSAIAKRTLPRKLEIKRKRSPASQNDSSGTETETETETDDSATLICAPTKSIALPASKRQFVQKDSGSETETDTEMVVPKSKKKSGVETELEDGGLVLAESKPGFPLSPEQRPLGPLVLDAEKKIQVPAAINTYLRDYQREGAAFFYKHYDKDMGGLLGDDMGLVISFLSAIMKKTGTARDIDRRRNKVSRLQDGPRWKNNRQLPPANKYWPTCLIIAPSSVVPNWEREFETWGYFEVGVYTGNTAERAPVLRDFKYGRLDVVITSFDLARGDIELLDNLAWSVVIIDEVHRLKNKKSKLAAAFSRFTCMRRFGLTGTAIQNSYDEMWAIADWTTPGLLGGHRQWRNTVSRPLRAGQSSKATEEERTITINIARVLNEKVLPHFFLRRTKDIIANQLPTKVDQVVFCPLAPKQREVYKRILQLPVVKGLVQKDDPCECGSRIITKKCCYPYDKTALLQYMSILIRLSNHLALILPSESDSPEQRERNQRLEKIAFPDATGPLGDVKYRPEYCGKWQVLRSLLTEWQKDRTNKVLIFSKSVKLIESLAYYLLSRHFKFVSLTGETPNNQRMNIVDQFQTDPDIYIFLISTLAGGVGLNLTSANKVVIFDPNWNPAHDLQAMDRAFRFGQTRDVHVYRLLGAGALEELVYARQIYKQQQMAVGYDASIQTRYFEGVQDDPMRKGELFGIKNIFKLHDDDSELATKRAIEKAQLSQLDWALSNMTTTSKDRRNSNTLAREGGKENDDLDGLGALLFDDTLPKTKAENNIQKMLKSMGVSYTHRNEDIIVPNRIEAERVKGMLQKPKPARKKARKTATNDVSDQRQQPDWPPKRRHHKPKPTPDEQLRTRARALLEIGEIQTPEDYPAFARKFGQLSLKKQIEMLAILDKVTFSDSSE
ncbi:hypothetical protein VKT23_017275 [Stygiomarasmius scandens]|uniref:Uncharacterized protein n=1 Tax=Marasmiellus scandens TaxID=2682957 RepID=A0ABR1IUN9_9AGAR